MDQDVTHRINRPSSAAPGPRYSLVWKMLWLPKKPPGSQPRRRRSTSSRGGGRSGAAGAGSEQQPGLARADWGEPQRVGSASATGPEGRSVV
jgi:probable phosphoglycerate mutase